MASKAAAKKRALNSSSGRHCFVPGCAAMAEWDRLNFFRMSFGDLPHWWRSTPWVTKYKTELPANAQICETHFEERFIDRSRKQPRLLVGTIPTLSLETMELDEDPLKYFCRFCAKQVDLPMKYRLDDLIGMDEVVECCVGKYRAEEGLSCGLCEDCVHRVSSFATFVKKCEEAQQQLLERETKRKECLEKIFRNIDKENVCDDVDKKPPIRPKKGRCEEVQPCPDCGKKFKTWGAYNVHLKKHDDGTERKRPFSCQICDKTYVHRGKLRVHLETVHGGEPKQQRLKCSTCSEVFPTAAKLKTHLEGHFKSKSNGVDGSEENQVDIKPKQYKPAKQTSTTEHSSASRPESPQQAQT